MAIGVGSPQASLSHVGASGMSKGPLDLFPAMMLPPISEHVSLIVCPALVHGSH